MVWAPRPYVAFIDLVKAFDSGVPREALYQVLERFGIPPVMLAIIVDMHSDVAVEITYEVGLESREFRNVPLCS